MNEEVDVGVRVYRVVWLLFCGVLGVFGAVVAFTWSLANVILLVVLAALTGAVASMVALENSEAPERSSRERRRVVARATALTAAGTLSFIGLCILLGGPTAVLVLIVVGCGSPYAICCFLHWLAEHGHLATESTEPVVLDPSKTAAEPIVDVLQLPESKPRVAPDALSDAALCLAWRASFSALQRAGSPTQRLRIVEERRAYLDEIERRTTDGMAAWLASGPRAAGDPSRFVLGDGAAGHARIDWDNLLHDMGK